VVLFLEGVLGACILMIINEQTLIVPLM